MNEHFLEKLRALFRCGEVEVVVHEMDDITTHDYPFDNPAQVKFLEEEIHHFESGGPMIRKTLLRALQPTESPFGRFVFLAMTENLRGNDKNMLFLALRAMIYPSLIPAKETVAKPLLEKFSTKFRNSFDVRFGFRMLGYS